MNSDQGQDYIGFVFGYQNNKKFYAVLWRHKNHNYAVNYRAGIKGVQIKVGESMFCVPVSLFVWAFVNLYLKVGFVDQRFH